MWKMCLQTSWLVITILALTWKTKQLGVIACKITNDNAEKNQELFNKLISKEFKVIYVNVSSSSFENLTLNQKEWSKVVEWIWVTKEYKHFLTYPVDVDFFTLGVLKKRVHNLQLNVNISNVSDCVGKTLWKQIYIHLFSEYYNKSGAYFCHRNFENENFISGMTFISYVSIGYGFHCFEKNDTSSPVAVEKSCIIYISISLILVLLFYYPLLLSYFLSDGNKKNQVLVYTEADYPYTIRRFLLHVIFKNNSIVICPFINASGVRLSILIGIATGTAFVVRYTIGGDFLPPNAQLYTEVHTPPTIPLGGHIGLVIVCSLIGLCFLVLFNSCLLFISKKYEDHILLLDFSCRVTRFISVSSFFKNISDQHEASTSILQQTAKRFSLILNPLFWCKIYLIPLIDHDYSDCSTCSKCMKYFFKLLISFFNFILNFVLVIIFSVLPLINIVHQGIYSCFKKCKRLPAAVSQMLAIFFDLAFFPLLLFLGSPIYAGTSYLVQLFIYFFLVAIPHLYLSHFDIFLIISASITYSGKFAVDFFQFYRLLLQKIIQSRGLNNIPTYQFDSAVEHCCPVTTELFLLVAKILLTLSLQVIMYITLKDIHFLNSQSTFTINMFLSLAFMFTPGLLDVLFFESNADKVERIYLYLENFKFFAIKGQSIQVNITFNDQNSNQKAANDQNTDEVDYDPNSLESNPTGETEKNQDASSMHKTGDSQNSHEKKCSSLCINACICCCGCISSPVNESNQWVCCFTLKGYENEASYMYENVYFFNTEQKNTVSDKQYQRENSSASEGIPFISCI